MESRTYTEYERLIQDEKAKEKAKEKYNQQIANQIMLELPKQIATPGLQKNTDGEYTTHEFYKSGNELTIKATPPQNSEYVKAMKNLTQEEIQKAYDELIQTLNSYSLIDLFNAIMNKAVITGFSNKWITLTLTEYLQFLGKEATNNQKKIARREITQNLQILERLNLKFKKGRGQFLYFDILLVKSFVKDEISIVFDDQFYFAMKQAHDKKFFTYIPKALNGVNNKQYPHIKLLSQYLGITRRINLTKGNREKTFKVQSVYDYVVTLPRNEKTNGHGKQQIIEPLEKNLNKMKELGYIKDWKYNKDFETKRKSKYSFDDWKQASLEITFSDELNLLDNSIKENKEKFKERQELAEQTALTKEARKKLKDDQNKVQEYIQAQVQQNINQKQIEANIEKSISKKLDLLDD